VQNEFLSSVSHELRTPLTSIACSSTPYAKSACRTRSERQRCLTVIHQELARLDGMVGKLIERRRSSRATPPSSAASSAVTDIVNDALAAFEAVRFGSEVNLEVQIEPGLMVSGDRGALAQVLGNC